MEDIFPVIVEATSGEGCFTETSIATRVSVLARTGSEAQLVAMEMVAARGRCPVASRVDWEKF
jgi:hypothetical protein